MLLLVLMAATPDAELAAAVERLVPKEELPNGAKGLIHLLKGERSPARILLEQEPDLALYLAMAELDGAGGLGRARETLAKAAKKERDPGVLFLTALAHHLQGDPVLADRLLALALKKSESVLDESFAPDPAIALAKLFPDRQRDMARLLLDHGRRNAAIRIAEKIDAKDLLVEAWAPIDPRRALRYAEDPGWRARLHWKLGEKEKAKAALDEAKSVDPAIERLRAAMLIDEGKADEALETAQEAARLDPRSDEAVRLVAEALILTRDHDRAHAFAEELLKRRPIEIDPYGLLARIQIERKRQREVAALEARSKGHQQEREKLEKARRRREAVLTAVRDAEGGLGTTGLEAVRGGDPELSLPIDLATAKLGASGAARAARDRILAACADDLRKLLAPEGTWDRVRLDVSPHGKVQKVEVPLSAADPGRCGGRVLRK